MYFLGLITRCKDEFFIEEFCNYYLSQGVDTIYIIDDNSINKTIYHNLLNNEQIVIHYMTDKNDKCHDFACSDSCTCNRVIANDIYQKIKNNFEWMIYVDVDEFVTTKKNIDKTIKDELQTTLKDFDCIKIPWIMMSCHAKKNPKSVLKNNLYRINYDKNYNFVCNSLKGKGKFSTQNSGKQIQTKSIFKCSKFNAVHDKQKPSDHHPVFPVNNNLKIINSVNLNNINLKQRDYNNINEKIIKNSIFLCYHYRIISEEHALNKLNTNNWYIENGYSLQDLTVNQSKDIIDLTLKNKII
jgi:hypothetical protein